MTKEKDIQAAGEKGSITPRTIKGNDAIEGKDHIFKEAMRAFITDACLQKLPEHSLVSV